MRPDGLARIPRREANAPRGTSQRANTPAAIYLSSATTTAGSVAGGAALGKDTDHSAIAPSDVFVPLAFETLGQINFRGLKILSELDGRLSAAAADPREASFLFQYISIERCNAICSKGILTQLEEVEF